MKYLINVAMYAILCLTILTCASSFMVTLAESLPAGTTEIAVK